MAAEKTAAISERERAFKLETTPITFGPGASEEAGWEMKRLGAGRVMIVSDPGVVRAGITGKVREIVEAEGIECEIFDRVHVEPTLESLQEATAFAADGGFDGFIAVGGGSSLDTAKVVSLVATHPAPVMDYVHPPVGGGRRPPAPLKPLLAIPTTAGTGSEATGIAVLDLPDLRTKAAISHPFLRPDHGIVDSLLTRSMPSDVTAACGLDVVCHAVESFTAKPFDSRPAPETPGDRPPFQGSNPVSDIWAARALEYGGRYLRRAVADGNDMEARGNMMLAASIAGIGFGSAGTAIPHACAYPIASLKHAFQSPGYPEGNPFVPHGFAVILTAPAAFRFTYPADPDKHRQAAEFLTGEPSPDTDENTLPEILIKLMKDVGAPSGLREVGYDENDIDQLVEGALKQQRQLGIAPREAGPDELAGIFRESL
ncbi:MAG TPA: hydroxyacid-oxoacid transhydrogenase [Rubrobacteraceae bacterium]|nr:hydroxyacid-oxoacid transhydrogenase [Rubrobacteraceae bacterium]